MGLVLINQPDPTPSRDLRVTGGAPEIVRLLVKLAKLDMEWHHHGDSGGPAPMPIAAALLQHCRLPQPFFGAGHDHGGRRERDSGGRQYYIPRQHGGTT